MLTLLLFVQVVYNDDTWLEGYFKDGVLHGFCRHFDGKGRLTFVGNYKNGRPTGVCWKVSEQRAHNEYCRVL